jgi:hypothetical protein
MQTKVAPPDAVDHRRVACFRIPERQPFRVIGRAVPELSKQVIQPSEMPARLAVHETVRAWRQRTDISDGHSSRIAPAFALT